ncbi:MAG: porin family protein [Alistipes sp.]|nr:porin family protein [Alistipes sp.]
MKKFYLLLAVAASIVPAMSSAQKMTVTNISKEKTYKTSTHNVDVWYQGELNWGYSVSGKVKLTDEDGDIEKFKTDYSHPMIETVHGVRITKYAFVGAGVALNYAFGKFDAEEENSEKWNTLMLPIFINLKGYYPVNDNFAPYISLSFGSSICAMSNADQSGSNYDYKMKGGFYGEYGVGFNYKRFNFGLGLQHQTMKLSGTYGNYSDEEKWSVNSFYVKLGLTF